jgi:hypothetical protein
MPTFGETMLLPNIQMARFFLQIFVVENCAQYGLDPVPDLDPDPKPLPTNLPK